MQTISAPKTYSRAADYAGAMKAARQLARDAKIEHQAWISEIANHQYVPVLRELDAAMPAPAKVLDWGCGYGFFSRALIEMGYEVTGFDFFDEMPTHDILRRGTWDYVNGGDEMVLLPFPDNHFDVVTSIGVLEHVAVTGGEEIGALNEIKRILKPGGVFVVSHLPNKASWIEWVARQRGRGHAFRYDRTEILSMLGETGYTIDQMWRHGLVPRNSLSKLPPRARDNWRLARVVDGVDSGLAVVGARISQNWGMIARP